MNLPPELIVLLVSTLPIFELRVGIPLGVYLGLPMEASIFWGILGNMLPIFFILKLLGPVSKWLMKHSSWFNKFFTKIFEKTHKKHSHRFNEIGAIFLVGFIAIPLPGTGAWTGALIAFLFNIPYWRALMLILLGVIGSAIIMSLGTMTVTSIPAILNAFIK